MNAKPSLRFDAMRATDLFGKPPHAARLLLQDLHPAAAAVAAVREGPAQRGRPRQAASPPARARVAHRVPPPPRRRAGDRRRRRRAWPRRCAPRRWAPTWSWSTTARSSAAPCSPAPTPVRARALARRVRARRHRGAGAGRRARLLRRDRPGLVREHPAPGPRRPPRRRDRLDRAAADVRGQRPSGGDAVLRRASGSPPSTGCAPGKTAVVATTADRGLESALALQRGGGRGRGGRRRPPGRRPTEELGGAARRRPGSRCCAARPWSAPFGRRQRQGTVVVAELDDGRPLARRHRARHRLRPGRRLRGHASRRPRCCSRPAPRPAGTRPPAPTSRRRPRRASTPPARSPATARRTLAEPSGAVAGAEAALSLELGDDAGRARGSKPSARRCSAAGEPRRRAGPGGRAGAARGARASASPASARTSPPTTSATRSTRASTRSSC